MEVKITEDDARQLRIIVEGEIRYAIRVFDQLLEGDSVGGDRIQVALDELLGLVDLLDAFVEGVREGKVLVDRLSLIEFVKERKL